MKKSISLLFAVVSTTFLFVGATQAAEKFDALATETTPASSDVESNLPPPPCMGDETVSSF
jgi:hypothetical protein